MHHLKKTSWDFLITKNLLKNIVGSPSKVTSADKIIKVVSFHFDLKERDILANSRKKEIVRPRQIAMYLLRKELKTSFPSIGDKFGGKDHTTAIHAYNKINKEIENNEGLNEEIGLIKEQIYRL